MNQKTIVRILLLLLAASMIYNVLHRNQHNKLLSDNRILKLESEAQETMAREEKKKAEETMMLLNQSNQPLHATLTEHDRLLKAKK